MILLDLLADLGVAEAAARATLKRMTQRGLLVRGQVGRTAEYALTPLAEDVLREARRAGVVADAVRAPRGRVDAAQLLRAREPARPAAPGARARLTWAGFGGLRDGLWIAPGTVDVAAVLGRSDLADVADLADAFAARRAAGHRRRPAGAPRLGRARRAGGAHLVHRDVEPAASGRRLPGPADPAGRGLAVAAAHRPRPARRAPGPGLAGRHQQRLYRRVFDGLEPAARAALERGLRASGRVG